MKDLKENQLLRVGIIGGGPSGALCAKVLSRHVNSVIVFDKGRGPGGRMSTRRSGAAQFDHGAQYMTARNSLIAEFVQQWIDEGVIATWEGLEIDFHSSDRTPREPRDRRLVGVPGMNAPVRHLLDGLEVRYNTFVEGIRRRGNQIEVSVVSSAAELFDVVVVALPAPQAALILDAWPGLQAPISKVQYHPCWATMMELSRTTELPWTAARTADPRIRWMARDSTKPGRPAAETWVLHATPEWTREHLNDSKEEVGRMMFAAFRDIVGLSVPANIIRSHRWLYALVDEPLGKECLFEDGVGVCGDALLGGRIESALISGLTLANRILSEQYGD